MGHIFVGVLGFVVVALLLLGGLALALIKLIRGGSSQPDSYGQAEEARIIQELHHGLSRMEERVEALETILLEKDKK